MKPAILLSRGRWRGVTQQPPAPTPPPAPIEYNGHRYGLDPDDGWVATSGLPTDSRNWDWTQWAQRTDGAGGSETLIELSGHRLAPDQAEYTAIWCGISDGRLRAYVNYLGPSIDLGPVAVGEKFFFEAGAIGGTMYMRRRPEASSEWVTGTAPIPKPFTIESWRRGRSGGGEISRSIAAMSRIFSSGLDSAEVTAESASPTTVATGKTLTPTWTGQSTTVQVEFDIRLVGGTPAPAPAPTPAPVGTKLSPGDTILWLGDSTVYGHNSIDGNQVDDPPAELLDGELENDFTIQSQGVGLATTSTLLAGTGYTGPLAAILSASAAKVIVYTFGINDSYLISDAQLDTNIRAIVAATRGAGKEPVFETPNPTNQNLAAVLSRIRTTCAALSVAVVDQHQYITGLLGGNPVSSMMPDGIHPSQATYALKAAHLAGRLVSLFDIEFSSPAPAPAPGEHHFFRSDSPWNAAIPPGATWYGPSDKRTAGIRKTTISGGSTVYAVNAQNYAINVFYESPGDETKVIRVRDIYGPYVNGVRVPRYDFWVTVPWPPGSHPAMGFDGHWCCHSLDGVTTHEFWYLRTLGGQLEAATYAQVRKDGTGWNLFPDQVPGMILPHHRNPAEATAGSGACRAVSVGLLGGLITKEDVDAGKINHALALALPRAMLKRGPRVAPADMTSSNYDGDTSSVGDVAYSMRFALPPSVNIASLGMSEEWEMVAEGFQTNGGLPVDVGGNGGREVMIYTQYPDAFAFGTALRSRQSIDFPKIVSRLEFVGYP